MAYGIGKDAKLQVTAAGGTTQYGNDLSAYLTQVSPSFRVATAEVTTFGDSDREYLASLKDATISFEGIWDPTPDNILFGLRGSTASPTRFYPQGTASGKIYYQGDAILTSYEPPANLEEAVTFSGELQFSGAITRATA